MPSRAEMRIRIEQVLRGIVIIALAVMLWQSLHGQSNAGARTVSARGIRPSALADWSTLAKAPATIHVQLDSVPSTIERAWLSALAGAGSAVTWSGDIAPLMIEAQPVASPSGGTKVLVAAPTGSVVVNDDVGPIDTLRAQSAGAMLSLSASQDRLTARVKGSAASTSTADSLTLHRVLVIADAGWESKFAIAALEEEGWKVDASIRVAPGVNVTQGSVAVIDTSRYSAVVALDGASSQYAGRMLAFAQMGGGVVLASEAASLDAMAPLRAGAVGRAEARPASAGGSISLATVGLAPITSLRSDAVVVERRGGSNALAARRIGAGRVLQSGYEDAWRLRTGGGDNAVRDHRQLWSGLVSRVAYAPRATRLAVTANEDQAPMVGLVTALGPKALSRPTTNLPGGQSGAMFLLFSLLALALIGEVASRRLRGAS